MYRYHEEAEFPNWWDVLDAPDEPLESRRIDAPAEHLGRALQQIQRVKQANEMALPANEDLGKSGEITDGEWKSRQDSGQVSESSEVPYTVHLSRGYAREVIENVWSFAEIVPGNDPDLWRKDEWGHWIRRIDYGRRESEFGWEIFDPGIGRHSQGVYAMRPMQWGRFLEQFEVFS